MIPTVCRFLNYRLVPSNNRKKQVIFFLQCPFYLILNPPKTRCRKNAGKIPKYTIENLLFANEKRWESKLIKKIKALESYIESNGVILDLNYASHIVNGFPTCYRKCFGWGRILRFLSTLFYYRSIPFVKNISTNQSVGTFVGKM